MSLLTDLSTGLLMFAQLEQKSSTDAKVPVLFVHSWMINLFITNCKYLPPNLHILLLNLCERNNLPIHFPFIFFLALLKMCA